MKMIKKFAIPRTRDEFCRLLYLLLYEATEPFVDSVTESENEIEIEFSQHVCGDEIESLSVVLMDRTESARYQEYLKENPDPPALDRDDDDQGDDDPIEFGVN